MKTSRPREGFLLVTVLFLTLILLVMGMAYVGSRASQYKSTYQAGLSAQARSLARAGIEDARVKLNKDPQFPASFSPQQSNFTYSEDLYDASGTRYIGCYQVTVETRAVAPPYQTIEISSRGTLGPRNAPLAQHTYKAYLSVSLTSPNPYRFLRWDDLGGP